MWNTIILILSAINLCFAAYIQSVNSLDESVEKPIKLLQNAIQHIRGTTEDSLDVIFQHDLSSDDSVGSIFLHLRMFLGHEHVPKIESSMNAVAQGRTKIAYILNGSSFSKLQTSLRQIKQSKRYSLADKLHQYYFILSPNSLTDEYRSLFKNPLSCHTIFIQLCSHGFQIYRISAANQHVRTFHENTAVERILDDRPDWYGYEARIWTIPTRPPFSVQYDGELIGIDIEACKTIFSHANMSYRFLLNSLTLNYWKFKNSVEKQLKTGSIQLVISRLGFQSSVGELLYLRDTDGSCLMVPRSLQRNFIYHLVHPFEFDTWMVVVFVLILDVILALFFPIAFPHNLIMILLFGDSVSDHQQTRCTRFYCFACTVFLFLLSEAYLAKAIIYMTVTRYAPNMKTLAEFIASDIPILIGPGIVPHLSKHEHLRELLAKTVIDPNFEFHLESDQYAYFVLHSHGQSLIEQSAVLNYMMHGREGKRIFYLIDQVIDWYFMQYSVQYQFMYYARFQLALNWLYEAGLWDKWKNDAQKKVENRVRYKLREEDDVLFLEDLVGVWYVSAAGWAISMVVFLMELLRFYGVGKAEFAVRFIRGKFRRCCRKL